MSSRFDIRMVAKPWGRDVLPPPFAAPQGERIGEVWFEPRPPIDDLLIKYIFTSEALSVQVHPSDAQAVAGGIRQSGKDECWLVIAAEPKARLGIGLRHPVEAGALRAAALDGSIEQLLKWHPVLPGDFFYIPAGTVHAIGAGVSLVEVQQNCDVTYRLYDYGRPRELHLDEGITVARLEPYDPAFYRKLPDYGPAALVEGPVFRLDRVDGAAEPSVRARYTGPLLVIPLDGSAAIAGETLGPGECGWAVSIADVAFSGRSLVTQSV